MNQRHIFLFYTISSLIAAAYIATLALTPYPFYFLVKALPCTVLAIACWLQLPGRSAMLMSLALLLSAFADAAIEFSFIAGLAAFLGVQLLYCVVYFPRRLFSRARVVAVGCLGLYLIAAWLIILPAAGELALPVGVYMAVICGMGMLAALYQGSPLVLIGSLLFMCSDTLIAVDRFIFPFELAHFCILVTYFTAQILIVAGVIRTETGPNQ